MMKAWIPVGNCKLQKHVYCMKKIKEDRNVPGIKGPFILLLSSQILPSPYSLPSPTQISLFPADPSRFSLFLTQFMPHQQLVMLSGAYLIFLLAGHLLCFLMCHVCLSSFHFSLILEMVIPQSALLFPIPTLVATSTGVLSSWIMGSNFGQTLPKHCNGGSPMH